LKQLKQEEPPKSPEEKETYFMSQVGLGEQLSSQGTSLPTVHVYRSDLQNTGPAFYLLAALAFFRALRVYPSPVELIVIYQKTIPEPVFKVGFRFFPVSRYSITIVDCNGLDQYRRK